MKKFILLTLFLLPLISLQACNRRSTEGDTDFSNPEIVTDMFLYAWMSERYDQMWSLLAPEQREQTDFTSFKVQFSRQFLRGYEMRKTTAIGYDIVLIEVDRTLEHPDKKTRSVDSYKLILKRIDGHWFMHVY